VGISACPPSRAGGRRISSDTGIIKTAAMPAMISMAARQS
jgi:hypothetical protein